MRLVSLLVNYYGAPTTPSEPLSVFKGVNSIRRELLPDRLRADVAAEVGAFKLNQLHRAVCGGTGR